MSEQYNPSDQIGSTGSAPGTVLGDDGVLRQSDGSTVDGIIRLLWEVGAGMNDLEHEMARASGTHPTDLAAISLLSRQHPKTATIGELGDGLGVTKTAATSIVDRLEEAGHVRRVRDTADRRRVHVEVTEAATDVAARVLHGYVERFRSLLANYDDQERATITRFLTDLRDALAR